MKKLIILLILCFAVPVFGADYTVCSSGCNYTITTFNNLTGDKSGNTYYFSGTFTTRVEVIDIYGTSGNPVVLDGYQAGDNDPINDCDEGNFTCDGNTNSSAILTKGLTIGDGTTGPDYVTVQDFRMTHSSVNQATLSISGYLAGTDAQKHCDYIIVRRNFVYDSDATMFQFYSGRYGTVEDNKFFVYGQAYDVSKGFNLIEADDVIVRGNELGHDESSYSSQCTSAEMIEIHGCKRLLIEYNDVYGAPQQSGIRPKEWGGTNTEDLIIRFNKVHGNTSSYGGKGIYARTSAGAGDYIANVYIYGNFVYNNYVAGIMFGKAVHDVHVWSNIVTDHTQRGVNTWDSPAPYNIYIYNNTITRNGDDYTSTSRTGAYFAAGTNINFKNNILWNNRSSGEGSNYNQFTSLISVSALEHNTYYHTLSDNDNTVDFWYYSGAYKNYPEMDALGFEDLAPLGEIADPGFINPDGTDTTYGTDDDDYALDGTNVNDGMDLSSCFGVTVQGTVYTICYDDGLSPVSVWTGNASTLAANISTLKRDAYGWSRGAYIYTLAVYSVSPANGATEVSITASATWDYAAFVDDVDLWLDKAACSTVACDDAPDSDDNATKTYDMSTLDVESTYCLGIKANDGASQGDCQEFEFTTADGPPVDPANLSNVSQSDSAGDVLHSGSAGDMLTK